MYRDEWDEIVSGFIQTHEPWNGYWALSEEHALRFVDRSIDMTARNRLLDLGCGRGRLLPRFAPIFRQVVALDSDAVRIRQTRALVDTTKLRNVLVEENTFQSFAAELGEPFDVILCSHVIQHMQEDSVQAMVDLMNAVLVPGGLLVLLTSHSTGQDDAYKLWRPDESGNGAFEESIQREGFDGLIINDRQEAGIPSHAFTICSLRKLLARMELVKVHCFHALHKRNLLDHLLFRDTWVNMPGLKGSFGIDVLAIGKKGRSINPSSRSENKTS